MTEMRGLIFSLLLFFSCGYGYGESNPRCMTNSLGSDQYPIVSTIYGDIMGSRKTEIDRRQNKSVTWTSYNVNSLSL